MSKLAIPFLVFFLSFGAGLIGLALHTRLPERHRDSDSRDVIKLVMGLIATMAALVLSLLVASANSSYQAESSELQSVAADLVLMDRMLSFYGPETTQARQYLREGARLFHDGIWSLDRGMRPDLDPAAVRRTVDALIAHIEGLSPLTNGQRILQQQILLAAEQMGRTRLLMFEQAGTGINWPFLAVLIFWITVLFLGFGLFTQFNGTVCMALLVGSLSVAGSIFLILELNDPYRGLMRISDAPLRTALAQIGG